VTIFILKCLGYIIFWPFYTLKLAIHCNLNKKTKIILSITSIVGPLIIIVTIFLLKEIGMSYFIIYLIITILYIIECFIVSIWLFSCTMVQS